jgi:hypothetical protein
MKRFVVLLVALMALCAPASAQQVNSYGRPGPSAYVFPVSYGAAGVATATTGTITTGTNSLSVASAAGWSPGMGIAVHNAGAGGTAELITTVSSIAGTTFTLAANAAATATTQAVNHDDTAALTACTVTSGLPCFIPAGTYNVTSATPVTVAPYVLGSGTNSTFIQNRSLTTDVFFITYYDGSGATLGGIFRDFSIVQSGVATNGFAFDIAPTGGNTLAGLVIENIFIESTYGGIKVQTGLNASWISKIWMYGQVNAGILYQDANPNGDNWFTDIEIQAAQYGVYVTSADTAAFTNLKLNVTTGTSLAFAASAAANVTRLRFINMSIEGGGTGISPSCGIDFGTNGVTQVQFIGGGVGLLATGICNGTTAIDVGYTDLNFYSNTTPNGRLTIPGCAGAGTSCVVSGLVACSTTTQGATSFVTDQNTSVSWHGAVTGSGSTKQAVVCNGSAWVQQ